MGIVRKLGPVFIILPFEQKLRNAYRSSVALLGHNIASQDQPRLKKSLKNVYLSLGSMTLILLLYIYSVLLRNYFKTRMYYQTKFYLVNTTDLYNY